MQVLKGLIVDHTKKEDYSSEERFYSVPSDEPVAKGDVFAVWAHGRLAFFKVKAVLQTYEYLKAENNGVLLDDIPFVLTKIDFEAYNINKAYNAKRARLVACLKERISEGASTEEFAASVKSLKGQTKKDAEALLASLKEIDDNPSKALED